MRTGDFRKFGTYIMDPSRPPPNSPLTKRVLAEPLLLEPYVDNIFLFALVRTWRYSYATINIDFMHAYV